MSGISRKTFEEIFNTWYEPIRNYIFYKTGEMKVAEDISQDVFLKVWEKRDQVRPETIKPYLYKLAGNLFINRFEHRQVELKFRVDYQAGIYNENPEYEMQVKEFDRKLQEALGKLDERNRVVFLMNRVERYTYQRIAERLGIGVKAVEKRMSQALSFLKKEMDITF